MRHKVVLLLFWTLLGAAGVGFLGVIAIRESGPAGMSSAASRGMEWLIANTHELDMQSDTWVLSTFKRHYRATVDETLADRLDAIIAAKTKLLSRTPLPQNLRDEKYLEWGLLARVLSRLVHQSSGGEKAVGQIQELLSKNEERFFSQFADRDTQGLLAHYLLKRAGIRTTRTYDSYLARARSLPDPPLASESSHSLYTQYLYFVTHVVFIASDYNKTYLDPSNFLQEADVLADGLRYYNTLAERDGVWDVEDIDIVAEIIWSYKLLGLAFDSDVNAARERLVTLQNADGSWGSGGSKGHNTHVAALALMEFLEEFRGSSWP